jgi:hypothetical protein
MGSGRIPDVQFGGDADGTPRSLAVRETEDHGGAGFSAGVSHLVVSGQRHRTIFGQFDIVGARDHDVAGNPDAARQQGPFQSDGRTVIAAENGVRAKLQDRFGAAAAAAFDQRADPEGDWYFISI